LAGGLELRGEEREEDGLGHGDTSSEDESILFIGKERSSLEIARDLRGEVAEAQICDGSVSTRVSVSEGLTNLMAGLVLCV
jgi:hypothetical protein